MLYRQWGFPALFLLLAHNLSVSHMEDPLPIAAGIAGLISLAQYIIQESYPYYNTAKDCPKEVKDLLDEVVSCLSGILSALQPITHRLASLGDACRSTHFYSRLSTVDFV